MNTNLARINISVRIDKKFNIEYSYIDPQSNAVPPWVKVCKLQLDQPTFCVFELETETVKSGWRIQELYPNGTPLVPYEPGAFNLSVNTFFQDVKNTNYKFTIVYHNSSLGKAIFFDPQELNEPTPGDCPPK
jgi:hypothetical protein